MFKYLKIFQCDSWYEFKNNAAKLLEKYNIDIQKLITEYNHTQTLTKNRKNSCLSLWMLKSFKTLKKYQQFWLKYEQHCKQDEQHKIINDQYEANR